MDHLDGDVEGGLGAEQQEAAPAVRLHARQIGAGEAHAGHDVDLPVAIPGRVVGVEEVGGLEDAQIADDDVGARTRGDQRVVAGRVAQVGGDAAGAGADPRHRGVDLGCGAAVDDDGGARVCEALGDREADALGRAGDDGELAGEIDLHRECPLFRRDGR